MRKIRDFEAYFDGYQQIVVYLRKSYFGGNSDFFYLTDNKEFNVRCSITSREMSTGEYTKYRLNLEAPIKIGTDYEIIDSHAKRHQVEYGTVVKTKQFDQEFAYLNDDLGVTFSLLETRFALWSPVASEVTLALLNNGKRKEYALKRTESGVFRTKIRGNLGGYNYKYLIKISGSWDELVDPYAKSLTANGKWGVIINPSKAHVDIYELELDKTLVDHVIYEVSVRDITSAKEANVKYPMTYLGLSQTDTSYQGYPTGIDYIADLGVTMVQLMPVYDFASVDETDIKRFYNWGYDPNHYMSLEGGFSTNPDDGYSRVVEFKRLVSTMHRKGIAVCLDLVYNHVFDMEANNLWKLIPNYFFRMTSTAATSNGSFCGNDYESQTIMGRKYLVDCCINWIKEYDIDAFRFDLMGIIDLETMNTIVKEAKKIKPNFLVYGEGWNMPTMLPDNLKTTIANNLLVPEVGFFSDRFRDVVKGSAAHGEESLRGYASNDLSKIEFMKNVLTAGIVPYGTFAYVSDPKQMVNYVECHDNQTLWDKLKGCCNDEVRELRIERQKLINACVLVSQGAPFLHSGQEFCRTKHLEHNSYRSNDEINKIDYQRMINYRQVVDYTSSMIQLRKDFPEFRLKTKAEIEKQITFSNLSNGALLYRITGKKRVVDCFINPASSAIDYEYLETVEVVANKKGYLKEPIITKKVEIDAISLVVVTYDK